MKSVPVKHSLPSLTDPALPALPENTLPAAGLLANEVGAARARPLRGARELHSRSVCPSVRPGMQPKGVHVRSKLVLYMETGGRSVACLCSVT